MTLARHYTLNCDSSVAEVPWSGFIKADKCHWYIIHGDTGADVRRAARQDGWKRVEVDGRKFDLCPPCKALADKETPDDSP